MKTRVVNLRKEKYDVYIGRPGRGQNGYFGNPFPVQKWGYEKCLEMYKEYFLFRIRTDPEFKKRILELKGKVLGCFCKPGPCHGDIIVDYLESK